MRGDTADETQKSSGTERTEFVPRRLRASRRRARPDVRASAVCDLSVRVSPGRVPFVAPGDGSDHADAQANAKLQYAQRRTIQSTAAARARLAKKLRGLAGRRQATCRLWRVQPVVQLVEVRARATEEEEAGAPRLCVRGVATCQCRNCAQCAPALMTERAREISAAIRHWGPRYSYFVTLTLRHSPEMDLRLLSRLQGNAYGLLFSGREGEEFAAELGGPWLDAHTQLTPPELASREAVRRATELDQLGVWQGPVRTPKELGRRQLEAREAIRRASPPEVWQGPLERKRRKRKRGTNGRKSKSTRPRKGFPERPVVRMRPAKPHSVRTPDLTYGRTNGFHPHTHGILFLWKHWEDETELRVTLFFRYLEVIRIAHAAMVSLALQAVGEQAATDDVLLAAAACLVPPKYQEEWQGLTAAAYAGKLADWVWSVSRPRQPSEDDLRRWSLLAPEELAQKLEEWPERERMRVRERCESIFGNKLVPRRELLEPEVWDRSGPIKVLAKPAVWRDVPLEESGVQLLLMLAKMPLEDVLPSWERAVNVECVRSPERVGEYLMKLGLEVASMLHKQGKVSSNGELRYGPWQVANLAADGDEQMRAVFSEIDRKTKGTQMIVWSRGAKLALGVKAQRDEEIEQEATAPDEEERLAGEVDGLVWDVLAKWKKQELLARLYEQHAAGGLELFPCVQVPLTSPWETRQQAPEPAGLTYWQRWHADEEARERGRKQVPPVPHRKRSWEEKEDALHRASMTLRFLGDMRAKQRADQVQRERDVLAAKQAALELERERAGPAYWPVDWVLQGAQELPDVSWFCDPELAREIARADLGRILNRQHAPPVPPCGHGQHAPSLQQTFGGDDGDRDG